MYRFFLLHLLLIVSVSLSLNFPIYSQTIVDPELNIPGSGPLPMMANYLKLKLLQFNYWIPFRTMEMPGSCLHGSMDGSKNSILPLPFSIL